MSPSTPGADPRDPFAILGVSPDTPFNDVKVVYRRLVRELHPDVNPDNPRARERFDAVQAAFESLRAMHTTGRIRTATLDVMPAEPVVDSRSKNPTAPVRDAAAPAKEQAARRQTGPTTQRPAEGTAAQTRAEAATAPVPGAPQAARAPVATPTAPAMDRVSAPGEPPALGLTMVPSRDRLLLQPRAQMLYVLVELKPTDVVGSSTQPLNLSLVLDHSSSMQRDDKLQRLKEAVSRIIDLMDAKDYLSVVTFGDRASVLLPSAPLGNKRAAKEALDGIRCRGGTEISTGIRAGLQELQAHASHLISQMILLTDGQTYGDEEVCKTLATQSGERQVQITALGLGDDWNSALLDELALRTGGYADYVQSAERLSGVFEEHLRTLQQTALRNVRMEIATSISGRVLRATWVAPGIKMLPLPAESPPAGQPVVLDLGRISTDRDYRLLLELVVAARNPGRTEVADVTVTYDVLNLGRENEQVRYHLSTNFVERWDSDPPVDLRVHDALRKITAHRLQEQAMQAIQEGQTQKGTANLRTAAKHLEDAGCKELADLAKSEADRVERQGQTQAGNMKRIIYGTRKLG